MSTPGIKPVTSRSASKHSPHCATYTLGIRRGKFSYIIMYSRLKWPQTPFFQVQWLTATLTQDVCKAIVGCLNNRLSVLPRNLREWSQELENFLTNWEIPCVGAWDGFHAYVSTKLKNFSQLQKKIFCDKHGIHWL